MNTSDERKAVNRMQIQKVLSLLTIAIGIGLLGFMITFEGELGAVPLLTLIAGTVWYFVVRRRQRRVL